MRLRSVLDQAARQDQAAVLQLSRRITELLSTYGAYTVRKDWSETTRDIVVEIGERWRSADRKPDPERHIDSVVKNRFWGEVIDLMVRNDARAAGLFYPTIRRLCASWDRSRQHETNWDDVVQETARQIWEAWQSGDVEKPWSLLYTIARRRFLDRVRSQRPEDELPDDKIGDEASGVVERSEQFTEQALETLEEKEREIIVMMDLEGHTRIEVARKLGLSEGEALSIRRAGLRRLWRWLGRDLPPDLREVWVEMFKGAKRATPSQVAKRLSLREDEVTERIVTARQILGLESLAG
ncbi:sigma-70 family RNA polymerase sigma factor [Myxococcota bacterium]|nr:sigma-70 family RNA polymerase sigma factor [Myxococcota bacterium]